jgi:hypothetical protein
MASNRVQITKMKTRFGSCSMEFVGRELLVRPAPIRSVVLDAGMCMDFPI